MSTVGYRAKEDRFKRLTCGVDGVFDALRGCVEIGPIGALSRVVLGLTLIYVALFGWDPHWLDAALGFVVMPGVVVALATLHARRSDEPLRAAGPLGHALNVAVFVPLFVWPVTAGGAALFYGGSMLVAAVRRSAAVR
jgi:hypothetical protein